MFWDIAGIAFLSWYSQQEKPKRQPRSQYFRDCQIRREQMRQGIELRKTQIADFLYTANNISQYRQGKDFLNYERLSKILGEKDINRILDRIERQNPTSYDDITKYL